MSTHIVITSPKGGTPFWNEASAKRLQVVFNKPTELIMTIFVFGSNLAGVHGAGAALYARKHHGAIYGQGIGLQGNSYGIPTKDEHIRTLPLRVITTYVDQFIEFAKQNYEMTFEVTRIGCGLAGYTDIQIAPLFKEAPENCVLPAEWEQYIN